MGLDYRCMKYFFLLCDVYLYSLFVGFFKVGKTVPITDWCDGHWFEVLISIWWKIEFLYPTWTAITTLPKTPNRFVVFSSSRRPKNSPCLSFSVGSCDRSSWDSFLVSPLKTHSCSGYDSDILSSPGAEPAECKHFPLGHKITTRRNEAMRKKKLISGHLSELAGGD